MGHSLSRDLIVLIACKIDVVDVVAVLSTCRACKQWDTPEFWKRLFSISFGWPVARPKDDTSWKKWYLSRHASVSFHLAPLQTFGGTLSCNNTLFVANGIRNVVPVRDCSGNEVVVDRGPNHQPEFGWGDQPNFGWRLSRFSRLLDRHERYYFEVKVLWVNPNYGDFIVGLSDVNSGKCGTNESPNDSCVSCGVCFAAAAPFPITVFSNWMSSWNMGGSGPLGVTVTMNVQVPFIVSCHYDRVNRVGRFAVNGRWIEPAVTFQSTNALAQPFVVLYSDGAHAQLLKEWVYPELWEWGWPI
jgi:hypothetical protein